MNPKILYQITEDETVATFLKGEFTSRRFGDDLRRIMRRLGISDAMVTEPDLASVLISLASTEGMAKIASFLVIFRPLPGIAQN